MSPEKSPRLSVLVAAWNEAAHLPALVASFLKLSYRDKELVLCAGGSDGTLSIAQELAGPTVRLLEQLAGEGKQAGLRKCLEVATGDVVFLTDADCILTDANLNATLGPILESGEQAVIGPYAPLLSQRSNPLALYRWSEDAYTSAHLGPYLGAWGVNGVNFAVTHKALMRAGGFEPEVGTGTDYHLALRLSRAGYAIRYVPTGVIETEYLTTKRAYVLQNARWLRSGILHGLSLGQLSGSARLLLGASRGLAVFALPLLTPRLGRIAVIAWCAIVGRQLLVRLKYLAVLRKTHPIEAAVLTPIRLLAYCFLDFAGQALALFQCLRPRWRRKW